MSSLSYSTIYHFPKPHPKFTIRFWGRNGRKMKRAKDKAITMLDNMEEPPDFISRLPDEVLSSIISLLPIDDGFNISLENHSDFTLDSDYVKGILRYSKLFSSITKQHLGNLTSCRLLHFPHLEVKSWLKILVEKNKGLRDLTLECELLGTTWKQEFSLRVNGWDVFSSLESLELIRNLEKATSIKNYQP
ncbi:F-box-like domain superfamily [Sesbania bispinosa]|nr:F-box-like domain superfamily [Sesbania bispinosa]